MDIKIISELEFNQLDGSRKLIINEASHQFALLNLGNSLGSYGISWGSDLIQPVTQFSQDKEILWIGVDQKVSALSLKDGTIILSIPLHTPIFKILLTENIIAV